MADDTKLVLGAVGLDQAREVKQHKNSGALIMNAPHLLLPFAVYYHKEVITSERGICYSFTILIH